jgi:ferritin-like metal-binding protein YciE
MPLTISNPRDLVLARLAELLFVERRLAAAVLPDLIEQAKHQGLVEALREHHAQTKEHVANLEHAFDLLLAEPASSRSAALEGLVEDHDESSSQVRERALADAFHAGAAARSEHLEIAAYSSLLALTRAQGLDELTSLLEANLRDEKSALSRLEKLLPELSRDAAALDQLPAA